MPFTIAIDFDGTLVEHEYPRIGPEVPGAFMWCGRFLAAGAESVFGISAGPQSHG